MLVLPYQTRFAPGALPWLTLVLIALNIAVFFGLQRGDQAAYEQAFRQYLASDLPHIELPRYEQWLIDRGDSKRLQRLRAATGRHDTLAAAMLLQGDAQFLQALRNRRVITADDPDFGRWSLARRAFDAALDRAATERFAAKPHSGQPWRLLTYQFLHADLGHLLGNMVVLLLAGSFAEAAIGRLRFGAGYLLGGALAAVLQLALAPAVLVGASGAIAAAMGMVATLYGMRRVPVFYWVFVYFDTARMPAVALLPVWLANEVYQWMAHSQLPIAYAVHVGGLLAGAVYAYLLKPKDPSQIDRVLEAEFAEDKRQRQQSELVRLAQEAAARLDTRRAARLYRELCELYPERVDYMVACFNMALLGADMEELRDAALRLLWTRRKEHPDELRKTFLAMTQPKVLQLLPLDEQLRLARRLVKHREDAAALRVLDGLLGDEHWRTLYARQIADCLLGLFTTYNRAGLKGPAEDIRFRLQRYFPNPREIGGLPPSREVPLSIRGASTRPPSLNIDLSR
ncbi:MAG: rhomboid family intramembrane serine protease [Sutterellaceae bacterium]|nr:rhomboid family intramembrane serine protease [Burkholderiaceae bacterium]MDW8430436.1 rhomboid family intramembrane serine protease [Sutterellaceae bacterium]